MMKVVILAGGRGTRLAEETELKPKPIVEVGERPLLWHIMKHYSCYGLREFCIALGYKGSLIKRYFLDYHSVNSDLTIELDLQEEERGAFARTFCAREFREHGLVPVSCQSSVSYNRSRGTLRGMHYQADPHPESKLVRVTRGRIFDVALDLRRDSLTHRRWFGIRSAQRSETCSTSPLDMPIASRHSRRTRRSSIKCPSRIIRSLRAAFASTIRPSESAGR